MVIVLLAGVPPVGVNVISSLTRSLCLCRRRFLPIAVSFSLILTAPAFVT